MSKIDLVPITGAQQLSAINDNFRKVEEALNDKVLYRDNPNGEPNQVVSNIDMNGKRIYNLPQPQSPSEPVRYQDLGDVTSLTEEARGYAEAAEAASIIATDNASASAGSAAQAAEYVITAQQAVTDAEAQVVAAQAAAAQSGASATAAATSATNSANSAAEAANKVAKTSDTGAALLPEGDNGQRPATETIPSGVLVMRGNNQDPAVYKAEYWDRVAAGWEAFASRTWVGQQVTAAVNSVKDWVNQQIGFAIIYPNGGTVTAPANVSINTLYASANPFPGHHVICEAEVLLGGEWTGSGWYSSQTAAVGVAAQQKGDFIYLQTGATGLVPRSNLGGNAFGISAADVATPMPCRVKVWELKGNIV